MSKTLAVTAQSAVRRSALVALAMGLSVAVVAVSPTYAWAKNDKPADKGNSNAGGNGNGNSNGNGNAPAPVSLPLCALSDLSVGAAACSGFFAGNLLSNSPADLTAQASALSVVGLANWDGAIAEPQLNLSSSVVDFTTALNGATWIGVHFGGGNGGPNPQGGGVTAFYRFDAGVSLASFTLNYGAASAARLYATGPVPQITPPVSTPDEEPFDPPPSNGGPPIDLTPPGSSPVDGGIAAVPEPASWALMILGFGAAGAILRRRRALPA